MEKFKEEYLKLSDLEKFNKIPTLDSFYYAGILAKSIDDDNIKIQSLNFFYDLETKTQIACSLKKDESKIEVLKIHYELAPKFIDIMNSFCSFENKLNYIYYLDETDQSIFIDKIKFENDEQIKNAINLVESNSAKYKLTKLLKDCTLRIEYLNKYFNIFPEQEIASIVVTLSDEEKINFFKRMKKKSSREKIINSILDESIKINAIKDINDDNLKAELIIGLYNDDDKLEYLPTIKEEKNRISVITSFNKDSLKLDQLDSITKEEDKLIVKMSVRDREILKKYFLPQNMKYDSLKLGKDTHIGIEIESEGNQSEKILGLEWLLPRNVIGDYWDSKVETKLTNGVEVTSPILQDSKEDIEDIYMINNMLQQVGQKSTSKCGGHIHVSSDILKDKEAYINLLEIFGNTEKIFYIITNAEGEISRRDITTYANSISPKINKAIEYKMINTEGNSLNDFISELQNIQKERLSSLNFLNINSGRNTVEFRMPNGTVNPDIWIENAHFFGRLLEVSQQLSDIEKMEKSSPEQIKMYELKEKLKEDIPEKEKTEILLDLLLEEKDKEIFDGRYKVNSELLSKLPEKENALNYMNFATVDFGRENLLGKNAHNYEENR